MNTQWVLDSYLKLSVSERGIYEQTKAARLFRHTAVGWCMMIEENLTLNEESIALFNPQGNHLASEHLGYAAELFWGLHFWNLRTCLSPLQLIQTRTCWANVDIKAFFRFNWVSRKKRDKKLFRQLFLLFLYWRHY